MFKKSLILLAALPLAGCFDFIEAKDPGPAGALTEQVSDVDELAVGGAVAVVVQTGQEASFNAEGPENMLADMQVEQDGDRLKIGTRPGVNWNWKGDEDVNITITVPMLTMAKVSGASNVAIDRIETDNFEGSVSGAGELKIGQLTTDMLDLDMSGAGDMEAGGTTRALEARVSGAGDIDIDNLVAETAELRVSGAGTVNANVTETVDARVSGAGTINVTGGAECDARESGAGTVNCN